MTSIFAAYWYCITVQCTVTPNWTSMEWQQTQRHSCLLTLADHCCKWCCVLTWTELQKLLIIHQHAFNLLPLAVHAKFECTTYSKDLTLCHCRWLIYRVMQNHLLTENMYQKCCVLIYMSKQIIYNITAHVLYVYYRHALILACHWSAVDWMCRLPTVYMCKKLRNLDGSRQSYYSNNHAYFLSTLYTTTCNIFNRTIFAGSTATAG